MPTLRPDSLTIVGPTVIVHGMMLIQPSCSLARVMTRRTVWAAALFLIGPVAVAELSVKLPALTAALLEEDGR